MSTSAAVWRGTLTDWVREALGHARADEAPAIVDALVDSGLADLRGLREAQWEDLVQCGCPADVAQNLLDALGDGGYENEPQGYYEIGPDPVPHSHPVADPNVANSFSHRDMATHDKKAFGFSKAVPARKSTQADKHPGPTAEYWELGVDTVPTGAMQQSYRVEAPHVDKRAFGPGSKRMSRTTTGRASTHSDPCSVPAQPPPGRASRGLPGGSSPRQPGSLTTTAPSPPPLSPPRTLSLHGAPPQRTALQRRPQPRGGMALLPARLVHGAGRPRRKRRAHGQGRRGVKGSRTRRWRRRRIPSPRLRGVGGTPPPPTTPGTAGLRSSNGGGSATSTSDSPPRAGSRRRPPGAAARSAGLPPPAAPPSATPARRPAPTAGVTCRPTPGVTPGVTLAGTPRSGTRRGSGVGKGGRGTPTG
eukprot:m.222625 g.222625  ORF g.222625 m.222625 type:complete len:418 (-) comp15628_c0_seq1:3583-4836(-)